MTNPTLFCRIPRIRFLTGSSPFLPSCRKGGRGRYVYPSDDTVPEALRGRQLIIADDVFRGRFRSSFEHPRALTPNKVLDYSIDLHSASHVFEPGHRIAVQVQSTWFPLIDRNPQTFQPSIFKADRVEFKAQTHSVFHTGRYPSAIVVDVATAGGAGER